MRTKKSVVLPRTLAKRMRWFTGAGAACIALIGVVGWFALPQGSTPTNYLLEAGYLEIVPPSKFFGPGTINTVEFQENGRVQLHPTCDTDSLSALLSDKIHASNTTDREVLQSLKKQLDISEKIKEVLASEAAIKQAKSISISFENVHIILITDEGLLTVRDALVKDHCQEAIAWNISNGGVVCQTRAVLEADVTYEIKYRDEVSASERARYNSEAAAKLAMVTHEDSTNRISGRRLFYGIKLAPDAFTLNTPEAKPVKCLHKPERS